MWSYTLLPKILNMSLTGGIVIALVLLIRLLLRKAPKIFSYALWAVVLFRLLCPVSFSSDFSLLNLFNSPTVTENSITYIPTDIAHNVNQQVNLPISGVSNAVNDALTQSEEQTAANPLEEPMAIATLLWLLGIAVMLIYSVISLLKLKRRLTGAVWLRDNIYLADHVATPFVIGVVRPKIYLPSPLSARERDYIILHEQTHIRRLDHIVKLVAFLALSIHWFNPLVWVAFVCCMKDMEMACDEAVMEKMGDGIRADYFASLLSLATGRKILAGAPLAFGEGDTKSRIKNVLRYKKPAFWIVAAAVVACIVLAVCLITNPRNDTIVDESEFSISVDGITVELGSTDAIPLDETESQQIGDGATGETQRIEYYDGFNVLRDSEQKIINIEISSGNISTHRGIVVGSTRNDVLVTYPEIVPEEQRVKYLWYEDNTAIITFEFQNEDDPDTVTGIQISIKEGTADETSSAVDHEISSTQADAAAQAQAVLDSVVSSGTVALTLTTAGGMGGGRYEVPSNPNQVNGFDSSFDWSYAEDGAAPSPEPTYSLKVESPDGTAAIQCWQGSKLIFCTLDGETFWLSTGVLNSDAVFDGTIFTALRSWYDEAEISGLRGDIVIPDEGQSDQEIAQAWTEAEENVMLRATPGSKYACTYVKNTASINEDAMDSWYPDKALETKHFYFSYTTVFVPENDRAKNWLMAGNTSNYEGRDAPSGALEYFHMGPMYLTEEGWRCDGAGTGP